MTELHPQLAQDGIPIGRFRLCRLLLMNDATYPWFILVPLRDGIEEIHALSPEDQAQLMKEITLVSKTVARIFRADKINVAALGNVVPQLHVHVVARFHGDPAWPAPIWGKAAPVPYSAASLSVRMDPMVEALAEALQPE